MALVTTAIAQGADEPTAGPASSTVAVDFARDIQPLLATKCVRCHGPETTEAGLRLDRAETAFAALESGNTAIVPRDPAGSELLRRVTAADDERMPPEGPPLDTDQIASLRVWIASGAPWPEHWAYRPLEQGAVPGFDTAADNGWVRTPVDAFVLAEMHQHGLSATAPADRRTLLRRVYFDLIGLPPTAAQIDAFIADDSPGAYERVVDDLLASPQYGERWARHWMDLVHYAETHGHDQDRPRDHAWPYRDYLIRSFNLDTPYAQFVREQVAGDVLYPDDPWALVATGFLAAGPWDESSLRDIRDDTLDRQIARYIDRDDIVTTVMGTFVSTTIQCARCHNHKFDPITQQDYYGLQAVFAGTDKGNRVYDPDPQIGRRRAELVALIAALPERVAAKDAALLSAETAQQVADWEQSILPNSALWQPLPLVEFHTGGESTLTPQPDGSLLAGGPRPETDVYTIRAGTPVSTLTGLRLEVLTHESLPLTGPGRQDNGNLHLNEIGVWIIPSDAAQPERKLELIHPRADFNQEGWTIEMTLDGNPATAWGIYPEVGKPHSAVFEFNEPVTLADGETLKVELQQTHGGGHLIGRVRLSGTDRERPSNLAADEPPPDVAAILRVPSPDRSDEQRAQLAAFILQRDAERELAALPPPQRVYCGSSQFEPDASFKPAPQPRVVNVLHRGEVTQPREEAQPTALSCVPTFPATLSIADATQEGQRRAALADWIADERNVLTWRSIANRVWQHHFGRGLVDTPNDFGRMGAPPTHPELLDWLACELRDNGGSLKALHRLIVTSSVYRQSSEPASADVAAIDGGNLYLSHMNRRRLDAESIRDAALYLAGTLNPEMGGPSVRQFIMTPGIHVTPNVDYVNFNVDDPANARRSVYRFVFRTLPDPFMETLDCPDGSQWMPQRSESVTALQALATLNDAVLVRQCEHLAAAAEQITADRAEQVRSLFRTVLGREPTDDEHTALAAYAGQHGLANAARVLLNTNEFMFVD